MNKTINFCYYLISIVIFVCDFKYVCTTEKIPVNANYKAKYTADIIKYEVVIPQRVNKDGNFISHLVSHHHSKRSTKELEIIFYKIPIGGKDYLIELTPNRKLISSGAVVEIHKSDVANLNERRYFEKNSTEKHGNMFENIDIKKLKNTDCHFSGHVKGENISKAALSTCYGLAGFIEISKGFYTIEPIAEHDPFVEDAYPHILYEADDLGDSSCHTMGKLATSLTNQIRKRRESQSGSLAPLYIETLIVMDKTFINHHQVDCENYVLTVFNMASNLFRDASLGLTVTLSIVRIIRIEVENHEMNLKVNADAEESLKYFQNWQYDINPGDDSHPNHHDVAVLLTRVDVCSSPSSCGLLGLSTIGEACESKLSAALCEDNGLRLGYIIAHEIGHLLGADHDSNDSVCNGTADDGLATVMHSEVSLSARTWSKCSQAYFRTFIESGMGSCLLDEPEEHQFTFQDLLPGVMYNADFQCKHLIAMNSRECDMGSTCESLNCHVPGYACIVTRSPPADGTHCGENMWCHDNKCLVVGERPGAIDGNWGEWSAWSDCSRTCGSGVASSVRHCDKPKPSHGGKNCMGESKRYKICATTEVNVSFVGKPCETGRPSFRDIQCGEFDDWIYPEDGKTHAWKAYYFHDDNPCILYCISDDKQVAALRPRVLDGTMCYRGVRDICIGGTCKSIPCDLHFDSNAVEDACGVCHGDGTGCEFSEGMETFTKLSKGLTKLVNIPAGTRNIKVEELSPTLSRIVVKDKETKEVFVKGKTLGMFPVPGSNAWLGMIKKNQEALNIPGPVTKPLSVWIQMLENVTVKWSLALPAEQQRKPEFAWDFLKWEPCSAKCGPGTQKSEPGCVEEKAGLVENSYCADMEMPPVKIRPCENAKCEPRWMVGDWKGCEKPVPGKKEKKRVVYCIKPIGEGEGESQIVADSECPQPKPKDTEPCENRQKREDTEFGFTEEASKFNIKTDELDFPEKNDLKHFSAFPAPYKKSETDPVYLPSTSHFTSHRKITHVPRVTETEEIRNNFLSKGEISSVENKNQITPEFNRKSLSEGQTDVSNDHASFSEEEKKSFLPGYKKMYALENDKNNEIGRWENGEEYRGPKKLEGLKNKKRYSQKINPYFDYNPQKHDNIKSFILKRSNYNQNNRVSRMAYQHSTEKFDDKQYTNSLNCDLANVLKINKNMPKYSENKKFLPSKLSGISSLKKSKKRSPTKTNEIPDIQKDNYNLMSMFEIDDKNYQFKDYKTGEKTNQMKQYKLGGVFNQMKDYPNKDKMKHYEIEDTSSQHKHYEVGDKYHYVKEFQPGSKNRQMKKNPTEPKNYQVKEFQVDGKKFKVIEYQLGDNNNQLGNNNNPTKHYPLGDNNNQMGNNNNPTKQYPIGDNNNQMGNNNNPTKQYPAGDNNNQMGNNNNPTKQYPIGDNNILTGGNSNPIKHYQMEDSNEMENPMSHLNIGYSSNQMGNKYNPVKQYQTGCGNNQMGCGNNQMGCNNNQLGNRYNQMKQYPIGCGNNQMGCGNNQMGCGNNQMGCNNNQLGNRYNQMKQYPIGCGNNRMGNKCNPNKQYPMGCGNNQMDDCDQSDDRNSQTDDKRFRIKEYNSGDSNEMANKYSQMRAQQIGEIYYEQLKQIRHLASKLFRDEKTTFVANVDHAMSNSTNKYGQRKGYQKSSMQKLTSDFKKLKRRDSQKFIQYLDEQNDNYNQPEQNKFSENQYIQNFDQIPKTQDRDPPENIQVEECVHGCPHITYVRSSNSTKSNKKSEKGEKEKTEKADKAEKTEKADKGDKGEKANKGKEKHIPTAEKSEHCEKTAEKAKWEKNGLSLFSTRALSHKPPKAVTNHEKEIQDFLNYEDMMRIDECKLSKFSKHEFDGSGLRKVTYGYEKILKPNHPNDKTPVRNEDVKAWTDHERKRFLADFLGTVRTAKLDPHPAKIIFKDRHIPLGDLLLKKIRKRFHIKGTGNGDDSISKRLTKKKRSSYKRKKPKAKDSKSSLDTSGNGYGTETRNYLNNLFRDSRPKINNKQEVKVQNVKPVIRTGQLAIDIVPIDSRRMEVILQDDDKEVIPAYGDLPRPSHSEKILVLNGKNVYELLHTLKQRSGRAALYRSGNSSLDTGKINIIVQIPNTVTTSAPGDSTVLPSAPSASSLVSPVSPPPINNSISTTKGPPSAVSTTIAPSTSIGSTTKALSTISPIPTMPNTRGSTHTTITVITGLPTTTMAPTRKPEISLFKTNEGLTTAKPELKNVTVISIELTTEDNLMGCEDYGVDEVLWPTREITTEMKDSKKKKKFFKRIFSLKDGEVQLP